MARRKIFAVQDLKNDGELLGEYTAKEASGILGVPCASVSAYANSGARLRGRYRIEEAGHIETDDEKWAREWDRERERLLSQGGGMT